MGKEKRGEGSVYPGTPFTDVEGSPWGEAICWAYKKGLFQGGAPLRFAPDRPMPRGQAAWVAQAFWGGRNRSKGGQPGTSWGQAHRMEGKAISRGR